MTNVTKKVQDKPQCIHFSATIPGWVKRVARKYLREDHEVVDLAKDLSNKTAKSVNHLAINCPFFTRTATLADIREFSHLEFISDVLRRLPRENHRLLLDQGGRKPGHSL